MEPIHGTEDLTQFEKRKQEHIDLALSADNQTMGGSGLELIQLPHQAIPDIDFNQVDIRSKRFSENIATPFFVSSMTAGHKGAIDINYRLAKACSQTGWAMGVGSQRRQLIETGKSKEWHKLKQFSSEVDFFGNIGITQLLGLPLSKIKELIDSIEAKAMIIHTNPLQECIQTEGTPSFNGVWQALESLCQSIETPIIIKETGCGFHHSTLQRLNNCGVTAVDVSGFGGTHWGRIEGKRTPDIHRQRASETFANWGISTVQSIVNALTIKSRSFEVWGSGGLRNGLDAAKVLALGTSSVGFAKPMLEAALHSVEHTVELMHSLEFELKVALFCSGHDSIQRLQETYRGTR